MPSSIASCTEASASCARRASMTTSSSEIEQLSHLAPLHNPPALAAVRQARNAYPQVPHVAVFDTAFHATLPAHAREYALPRDLRERFGIRRYGFHGISHAHVMHAVATHLQSAAEKLRIVSCHLGNGASVTAIEHGRSVDTSMGMTPLEGLVMGTRAGDLDPGIVLELVAVRLVRRQGARCAAQPAIRDGRADRHERHARDRTACGRWR